MYVDAFYNQKKHIVSVIERAKSGKRIEQEYPAEYSFYYEDKKGKYTSLYGTKCKKFSTLSKKKFTSELYKLKSRKIPTFESDVPVLLKVLEKHYLNASAPNLNITFFDIETNFCEKRGFSPPSDPFNNITAISLYNNWEDICYTLVLAPDTVTQEKAQEICDRFDNTYLCPDEETLLEVFLGLIEDSDVITGWNSEFFDIPYTINRIVRVLGKDYTRKMCLWGQFPTKREAERYGNMEETYDLLGRVHVDYLKLYKKYTYQEQPSYKLDYIGEIEVKEKKVAYEGSLDKLYKFDFEKFIEYSRQDTMLMVKIDAKLKFISLINNLAHENAVPLAATMGTVTLSDNAIVLEAHANGVVVPDRVRGISSKKEKETEELITFGNVLARNNEVNVRDEEEIEERTTKIMNSIAGAYVVDPKKGLTKWIGSMDLVSLYPSIIMALNISPETIIGQLKQTETRRTILRKYLSTKKTTFADSWAGHFTSLEATEVFNKTQSKITFETEDDEIVETTGQHFHNFIFDSGQPFTLSANGTVFRHDKAGVIPTLIERWFTERKEMQTKAKTLGKILESADKPTDPTELKKMQADYEFWDQRQLIKKIQLNSIYGALTNEGSRFFDQRMGQSITLTGRSIAKHMASVVNEILTQKNDHVGETIVYGDTDSIYFSASSIMDKLVDSGFEFTQDNIAVLYDGIASETNATFPSFMQNKFNCSPKRSLHIKANREICGETALFVKKKRYAVMVYDDEGKRPEGGKLKIMGMETQRSDTPKFVQDFLKQVLKNLLTGMPYDEIVEYIGEFRAEFKKLDPWKMGSPKQCNSLTKYSRMEDDRPNSRLPGHIRAAYNWNKIREMENDNISEKIPDGGKTIVCRLKKNRYDISSIAYPIDQDKLPRWFTSLPFDTELMEEILIDKKVKNLIGVLNIDISESIHNDVLDNFFKLE